MGGKTLAVLGMGGLAPAHVYKTKKFLYFVFLVRVLDDYTAYGVAGLGDAVCHIEVFNGSRC